MNDIFTIDVNKVVLSVKVSCNTIIPLFIKTPKNILSYDISQYDQNSAYKRPFNVSEIPE